jgi:hypothetical protein
MMAPVLAVFLLLAIGWALARRHVMADAEAVSIGRVTPHDAGGSP